MFRQVRQERSGFRDKTLEYFLSDKGWKSPLPFVECLGIEYDNMWPILVVAYVSAYVGDWSYMAQAVGNFRHPVIWAYYEHHNDVFSFVVRPLNARAARITNGKEEFSEHEFVKMLYRARGRKMPDGLAFKTLSAVGDESFISRRHRSWDYDSPITDLDFLLLHPVNQTPVAFFEFKRADNAWHYRNNKVSNTVMARLSQSEGIPWFFVAYKSSFNEWRIEEKNNKGKKQFLPKSLETDGEGFVRFLRQLERR